MPYHNDNQDLLTSRLRALIEVAEVLAAHLELPLLLQSVTDKIIDVLEPAELGVVLLWDPSAQRFRSVAMAGEGSQDLQPMRELELQENESITGKVHAEQTALLLSTPDEVAKTMSNMRPHNRALLAHIYGHSSLPKSVIAAPLFVGEQKYGVLVLETLRGPVSFTESDITFVQTIADLIALEIDRTRLDTEATASREAQEANRLRNEIMAMFSHELRTPLAAIKGYSTALLLEEVKWPAEKRREFLRLIDEECDNLEGMISDILDAALIDAHQMEIEPQPVRLPRLAQEIADEVQRFTDIHRFVVDFPPEFPIVEVDPRRIKQVFRNIIDNAIKYSPDRGLVVIRGEVRETDVVVSVADQGVGISAEDLIPLFDKYFRVKAPTGYHVPGTGLGLPVSREIVEAHGGRIWANSKIGEGTTLYFSIPLQEVDEETTEPV